MKTFHVHYQSRFPVKWGDDIDFDYEDLCATVRGHSESQVKAAFEKTLDKHDHVLRVEEVPTMPAGFEGQLTLTN